MEFTPDVVDYGDANELHVSGIASITKISDHMVRVTLFTEKAATEEAPKPEKRVTIHLVWDVTNWLAAQVNVHNALTSFMGELAGKPTDGLTGQNTH